MDWKVGTGLHGCWRKTSLPGSKNNMAAVTQKSLAFEVTAKLCMALQRIRHFFTVLSKIKLKTSLSRTWEVRGPRNNVYRDSKWCQILRFFQVSYFYWFFQHVSTVCNTDILPICIPGLPGSITHSKTCGEVDEAALQGLRPSRLARRRIRGGPICLHTTMHGLLDFPCDAVFAAPTRFGPRGPSCKIHQQLCKTRRRQHAFSAWVFPYWNKLPE